MTSRQLQIFLARLTIALALAIAIMLIFGIVLIRSATARHVFPVILVSCHSSLGCAP